MATLFQAAAALFFFFFALLVAGSSNVIGSRLKHHIFLVAAVGLLVPAVFSDHRSISAYALVLPSAANFPNKQPVL